MFRPSETYFQRSTIVEEDVRKTPTVTADVRSRTPADLPMPKKGTFERHRTLDPLPLMRCQPC